MEGLLQMIKEILEQVLAKQTNLVGAAETKFLAVIEPCKSNLVHSTIKYTAGENGCINIVASIYKDELLHFKCKAQLQAVVQ